MEDSPQNPSFPNPSTDAKSIYLRFASEKDGWASTWHKIDISMEEDSTAFVSKTPINTPPATNSVALGSVIYSLGSSVRRSDVNKSRDVYYLDTRCPDLGWKKAPPLVRPRGELYLVVHRGEIYAVERRQGCYPSNLSYYNNKEEEEIHQEEYWCEVLDPISNSWKPMVGPDRETLIQARKTKHSDALRPSGGGGGEGFLVDSEEGLFWYDLDCNTYSVVETFKSSTKWEGAIMGDIVYYFYRRVCSYDLAKGRFHDKWVKGLEARWVSPYLWEHGYEENHPTAFVVRVGEGRLCLLYLSMLGLHCTRFRVSVYDDGDKEIEIFATIEAYRVFQVDQVADYDLYECLAI